MALVNVPPHELPNLAESAGLALSAEQEVRLVALLNRHFGDGSVYLPAAAGGTGGAARDCPSG